MRACVHRVRLCVCTATTVSASPPVLLLERGGSSRKPLNVKENSARHGKHPAERRDRRVGGRSLPSEYGGIPRTFRILEHPSRGLFVQASQSYCGCVDSFTEPETHI